MNLQIINGCAGTDPGLRNFCMTVIIIIFLAGFWSELLGVGDLYYELGVQVVELCVATSHLNGGMLPMADALKRLNGRRARKNNPIAE